MNDRELLELAAKACGMTVHEALGKIGKPISLYSVWDPLNDDGDALRLAVKIGFDVRILHGDANYTQIEKRQTHTGRATEYHGNDPYAATRRAIVRAAAEIGKSL